MMSISEKRTEQLTAYLTADLDRAKTLLTMSPENAVTKINAEGYDFTTEELISFGEEFRKAVAKNAEGEVSEEDLEDVAGGIGIIAGSLIALGAGIAVGAMDHFGIW